MLAGPHFLTQPGGTCSRVSWESGGWAVIWKALWSGRPSVSHVCKGLPPSRAALLGQGHQSPVPVPIPPQLSLVRRLTPSIHRKLKARQELGAI